MPFTGFKVNISFLWVEGMAIYPFVFIKKGSINPVLLNHECIHLRQQLELGLVLFYIWYSLEYLFRLVQYRNHHRAYMSICFEREAYANERNMEYLSKRKFWAFLAYSSSKSSQN